MQDFIYHNPVKILFGHDQIPALAQEVPQDKKVMIVYGGGSVIKHGILQRVKGSLKNTLVFEFGGVEPNPHYETLMKAVEIVKAEKIDFLLAVGGGSVIDGTKFIAAAALYENRLDLPMQSSEDQASNLKYLCILCYLKPVNCYLLT